MGRLYATELSSSGIAVVWPGWLYDSMANWRMQDTAPYLFFESHQQTEDNYELTWPQKWQKFSVEARQARFSEIAYYQRRATAADVDVERSPQGSVARSRVKRRSSRGKC